MAQPCPCLPTPGILGTESQRAKCTSNFSGRRGLRNGSERFLTGPHTSFCYGFCCPQLPNPPKKAKSTLFFFQVPVSKFFKDPPSGSKDQGYKSKESEKRLKRLLRDLDVVPCGWGPYCKTLNRQCRRMVKTREKVKLDGEYKRLDVS